MKASAILLSGGKGLRMGHETPKQYLKIQGQPIALYSFLTLAKHPLIQEVIVVLEEEWQPLFQNFLKEKDFSTRIIFAASGKRRQDSLYSGLKKVDAKTDFILVHDAARPFIDEKDVTAAIDAAKAHGAATLSTPVKATIRIANESKVAVHTPERDRTFEIQTPQVLRHDILQKGFEITIKNNITVTDDVALAELAGHPILLIDGREENFKITTKKDLILAEELAKTFFVDDKPAKL